MQNAHTPMSAHRLARCLATLGWSVREYARRIGEHPNTARRQIEGRAAIDFEIARWLDDLVRAHEEHPCPRRRAIRVAGEILS